MKSCLTNKVLSILVCLQISPAVLAATITPTDFQGNEIIQDFELGIIGGQAGPLSVDGVTFTTTRDDNGQSPSFLINDFSASNTFGNAFGTISFDLQYIDVTFDTAVQRAGAWVGISDSFIEFFDINDVSLGSVNAIRGGSPVFGGWDAGSNIIKRVRFTDVEANDTIISIDNLTTEVSSVPVPSAVWLFGSGLMGLVGMARRKKAA